MKLDDLRKAVENGSVDTVLLTIADMEGRLQGKRFTAGHFLDEVVEHDAEGCNYLLAVDVDMNTVDGYAMSSWERGYGDFVMKPDFETLRPIPWHEGTVQLMADLAWEDGSDVVASPRQILRRQLARLAERGWVATAGTELEFIVFKDSYEEAWRKGYRDLDPANLYNVDYSMIGTARVEPLLRRIRNSMTAAGMRVENSKGECNFGQHEINFHYGEALATADDHAIYKTGAKEIAAQEGMAITYMAKLDEREGNSCHIHCSLQQEDGGSVFAADQAVFDKLRGRPARRAARADADVRAARELLQALRGRLVRADGGGLGQGQPHLLDAGGRPRPGTARGEPPARRGREPVPGAGRHDRGRLHGIDNELPLEPAFEGNAYESDKPHVPHTMYAARDLFAESAIAARGVRRGSRGPLPEPRADRAGRLRGRRHRLGEVPRLRAAVSRPVIGICTAIERASWGAWEVVLQPLAARRTR